MKVKMKKKPDIRDVCLWGGGILIVAALIMTLAFSLSGYVENLRMREFTELIYGTIPEPYAVAAESRGDNTMPTLTVGGKDFSAVLEFPRHGEEFPVLDVWNGGGQCPSRYTGSIYDGTLVIGATNRGGQIDFVKNIFVGEKICLVDMTGGRYSLTVTDIEHRDNAENEILLKESEGLTLLVKNIYDSEYIIIRCAFA